ncbi:unnamed protein product [Phaedon cochleariae]|uniref:C2H2-type domain-containing protein n=1 Tax=Phaedon cochleariae TaxID=80249 RepID=A0A9P0DP59_PHACE|nr:unnamed protein product [Phaedon cochleariae]
MFPANFHSNGSSENISRYVTGSSELLVPGRVTAAAGIPQGTATVPIEPYKLLGHTDVQQISVACTKGGTIDLDEKYKDVWSPITHWIRAIRLSDDCHSYNVQLKLHAVSNQAADRLPKLMLQAVRPVEAGQELLLWFSEDVLATLQIAFLTPANIQGQKKYVCNRCSALYESPNPLKLHITLGCGKLPISSLWQKLSNFMNQTLHVSPPTIDFQLTLPKFSDKQKKPIDLTTNTAGVSGSPLYRPYEKDYSVSAFKPFRKEENVTIGQQAVQISPASMCFDPRLRLQVPPVAYNDEAHIETLVSSLGRSRQGHVCLYCGKCYSRKYGLKIHIRTHTGYKPLHCKYCSRPFGDPSNLNKHVRLHAEGNTPYKCDLCGKILVRRRDLERHLKSRHLIETHPGMNLLPDSPESKKEISDEEAKISVT